jgi:hypothetical protein
MGAITGNGQAQTGLGGAAGFGEILLGRSDDGTFAIDTSAVFENGFAIGGANFAPSALYVATDGLSLLEQRLPAAIWPRLPA